MRRRLLIAALLAQPFAGPAVGEVWKQGYSRQAQAVLARGRAAAVDEARGEACFATSGFYFSGSFDAAGRYVGQRRLGAKSFEVVEVKPWNAEARELWFDKKTGLLARESAHGVTTEFSDYRKV